MKQLRIFKLINGEDVLAQLENQEGSNFTLLNPVGITIVRGPNGQPSVGFSPFPIHAEQEQPSVKMHKTIDIPKSSVVYSYDPAQDFKNNYDQLFGAGIVLPNKQIITG